MNTRENPAPAPQSGVAQAGVAQTSTIQAVHRAAEAAARSAYGRLLAYLAYRWRDIDAAQDALAEAFASALENWPKTGVPDSPEAWLMTAAKRNLLQKHRHEKVTADPAILILLAEGEEALPDAWAFPDDRLKLLFVCAHPAIDPEIHTALMLQTVLGLDAKRIASAFLVSPTSMAQRLVRAKTKIAQTHVRFEEPEAEDLDDRVHAVLEAIYAAYVLGWDTLANDALDAGQGTNLVDEALYLADLTATLLPMNAESAGLLALLLFCEARREARTGPDGEFVPLKHQDCSRWDISAIRQGSYILARAKELGRPGPFQLEAAIQSAHCDRAYTGAVPWADIARLYDQLVTLAPTVGAQVGRAVAVAESGEIVEALAQLQSLQGKPVENYQPYWTALGHVLALNGQPEAARSSYQRALGLTSQSATRHHLQNCMDALERPSG
jgi:RNA polymerase sigma-70 factor, ECF subfamily